MRKILMAFCVVALSLAVVLPVVAADKKMVVGSKAFTEQRLLGQIMIQLLEKNGFKADDKTGLGGTLVVREALVNKQIDIAMEYTGTGLITILKAPQPITDPVKCYEEVKKLDEKNGMVWLPLIPFNNTYCLMMRNADAQKLGIKTLSDLAQYVTANPDKVAFGLNAEFYSRPDGYKPLQAAYDFKFPEDKIIKMDPGLLYKALKDGQIQVSMGFSTHGPHQGVRPAGAAGRQELLPGLQPLRRRAPGDADGLPGAGQDLRTALPEARHQDHHRAELPGGRREEGSQRCRQGVADQAGAAVRGQRVRSSGFRCNRGRDASFP